MRLAILCPGQGAQHTAMLDIVADHPDAETVLDAANRVLPIPARELVARGDEIHRNRIAQPLLCTTILARWRVVERELPKPSLVLGYSVGELAAHAIAGTFTVDHCIALAAKRAELMDEASPTEAGLMAVLGLSEPQIRALCESSGVEIAIANGRTHFVLGGPSTSLDAAARAAESKSARVVRLCVDVPAHTRWLLGAADAFASQLASVQSSPPRIPVLAGIDGHAVRSAADAAASLSAQIARTVDWRRCIDHAVEMGVTVFFELGPGNALSRMVTEAYPNVEARSLDDFRTAAAAVAWINRALAR